MTKKKGTINPGLFILVTGYLLATAAIGAGLLEVQELVHTTWINIAYGCLTIAHVTVAAFAIAFLVARTDQALNKEKGEDK